MRSKIRLFAAIVNAVIAAYFFQYATVNEIFAIGAIPNTLAALGFLASEWFGGNSNPRVDGTADKQAKKEQGT